MKKTVLVSGIVIAFLWPACTQAEIVYEIIDLGTLGGYGSEAQSMNDAGQIVGWAINTEGWSRATLFDPTGAANNIDLGTLLGTVGAWDWKSRANSINEAGQIVGWATPQPGGAPRQQIHAVLFDPTGAGNNMDLGALGGGWSDAYSINEAGQIVGWADGRATLFDPTGAGNNIDLGTLGGDESEALCINEAGQVVGRAENNQGYTRATLFDSTGAGSNIDLGTLGGDESGAYSINHTGQVVGEADNSEGLERATLFDPTGAGNNIDLGTLGGDESEALCINDAGQVVGRAENSQGYTRATLFDSTGADNNIDLNTLIDPDSGWTLRYANDINTSAWIVGAGINPQGEWHAFLLVPELATIALLGLGILYLRRRRK